MKSEKWKIGKPEHAPLQLNKIRENWIGDSHEKGQKEKLYLKFDMIAE